MDQATTVLEATKLAVGLAKDLSVQLLTLSSALIGLTVVLIKDVKKTHNRVELVLVILVLLAYIGSIACGIYAIMKLIGSLAPVGGQVVLSVDAARPAASWQIISFLVATFLFSLYGVIALVAFWWRGGQADPATPAPATVLPGKPPPGPPPPGTASTATAPPATVPPVAAPPTTPTS
jgi:hypothetical protein